MKSTIVVICALIFNSIFAVELPKSPLEKLASERFRGNEPLAKPNDIHVVNLDQPAIVITKANINRDLGLYVHEGMRDIYNENPELLGKVLSLDAIQTDKDGNVDIRYQEGIELFPCIECILRPQSNKIKEIAKKSPQELNNDDAEFREKIINKCIGLFIIQLFLNNNLISIAQSFIQEEYQLRRSMEIIDLNWQPTLTKFYAATYRQDTIGIFRIANLAIANISFLLEKENFYNSYIESFSTILSWQGIFKNIPLTNMEKVSNFQSIRELINSMNSNRIIIRSNLHFLYNNTFLNKKAFAMHFISVHSNQLPDAQNKCILRKLMLETCVKPNYINYKINTVEEDSFDKKDDEYTLYTHIFKDDNV